MKNPEWDEFGEIVLPAVGLQATQQFSPVVYFLKHGVHWTLTYSDYDFDEFDDP
ncbi:MAG: hypothetical protein ABIQ40_12175 [Bacteroidia bacterium]